MIKHLRFLASLLLLAVASVAWGEQTTVTASKVASSSASWTGSGGETWSVAVTGGATNQNVTNSYAQVGTKSSPSTSITFSTSGISGTITSVVIDCASYSGKATVSCTIDGTAFGTQSQSTPSWSNSSGGEVTFEGNASGAIVLTMTNGDGGRAMYIKSIVVTYTTGGSTTDPSINAGNVEIEYNATSGNIEYSINNANGETLSASTTSDWLTLGTVSESTVPFTCSANDAKSARTATVTLTYGDFTKNVTVTQAAKPLTIAEVRDQGTGSVTTMGIVTSCVGTTNSLGTTIYTGYIQDETAAICVYGTVNLVVGDEVKVSGNLTNYKGLLEISDPKVSVLSSGTIVDPTLMTIADVNNSSNQGWLVKIENATVTIINGDDITISQGDNTILVHNLNYTGEETVEVNDKITLTANIGWYDGVQLVNAKDITVTKTVQPAIVIEPATVELEQYEDEGTIEVTYQNVETDLAELQICDAEGNAATYDWITAELNNDKNIEYLVDANTGAARTAYMKVYCLDADGNDVYSDLITITQAAYAVDYAVLPFEFNGGKADIERTVGLTQSGLGSDYTSAPKLKFDNAGDVLVLKFNERPGKLTFDIKGNSFSGGTFKVQTSEDGEAYTDLATYTELGATQSEKFDVLGENVRYIKWVYTEKSSGNVALGNITLAEYSETPVETPTVNVGTLTNVTIAKMWIGDDNLTDIEDGAEVEAGTEVFVEFTVAEGYTFESFNVVDADGNEVTVTENSGNWSFVMPESNVTITATATENTPAGDKTLTNANIVAAGNGDTSYKEWTITDTNGKDWKAYAIKNQHSNATSAYHYLQIKKYASSTAYYLQVPEYGTKITKIEMTVSGSSKPMADGGNTATLFFSSNNSTSATGDGVASGTGASTVTIDCSSLNLNTGFITASGAVRIWDVTVTYEEASQETVPVSISSVGMATFSSTKPLDFTDVQDIYAYKATVDNAGNIAFTRVYQVPAKTGLLLRNPKGGAAEAQVPVISNATAIENNALVAVDTEIVSLASEDTDGTKNYILNNGSKGIGFYKAAGNKVGAGKAYLHVPAGGSVREFIGFEDETDGIGQIENGELTIENSVVYDLSGRKINEVSGRHGSLPLQLPKGIYIVNGKKVVVK